ncbi:fungal specific transcription factor domain-containing protein [Drepanopeziza brunnea f. sp. 'multigermtubi' MB_m1]|uniref:Fungal specific transcription factor domain-containing protein n=1 Tax=Marssonina brunnea f. sp. multigermtubi (strain MB_m1) TaxID=1072389 RepID=K1X8D4_MARBU|nr:fungal specific transcription factor domain-containing protein [Drepanopeziza brunnea f. sp. 'multigermtubi' MB_m1]EKD21317.1 fungal specific transcription factor domain-containing protein [Drepanopeziza brunnea f. sp. 'multigermtubi' MB_m1]
MNQSPEIPDFNFADPPNAGEPPRSATTTTTTVDGRAPEKTISCVSCRKRKLKCDRIKPKCGTCLRLRHECEYPERRKNLASKRRNMKELEARLAEVETKLVSDKEKASNAEAPATAGADSLEADWNASGLGLDMNINMDDPKLLDPSFEGIQNTDQFLPLDDNFPSQELIELGLEEPLPPQDMIDELNRIYFAKFHPTMPMIHIFRYYASLDRAPQARPPVCLRYAIWALAACLSDKYTSIEEVLYERARRYIQAAEMKGHGEQFLSMYHAQTWSLIAFFEAMKTYFTRSWMSTGRAVRLVQMLGLYKLDADGSEVKQFLPPARDWIELEERRRTFWAAFYGDRWASSGTGWPMLINESEIMTNLPSSEESFERGVPHESVSLAEALTPEGAGAISPFGGVILSAALYGKNFSHLHRTGPNENPGDLANGEFWKRHRKMDNVLSNTFMFLPDHLRLPAGLRDMSIVFIHLNLHSSSICLHQAAIVTASKYKLDSHITRLSHARCLMAAEEITNIMRLICHVDVSTLNSWVGFCLYVAAGVFLKDMKSEKPGPQSMVNIDFLLAALRAVGKKHPITRHFSVQLELDIEGAGLKGPRPKLQNDIPNIPINGLLAERNGVPMTVDNLNSFAALDNSCTMFDIQNGPRDPPSTFNIGGKARTDSHSSLANSPNIRPAAVNTTGSLTNGVPTPIDAPYDSSPEYESFSRGRTYTFPHRQAEPTAKPAGVGTFTDLAIEGKVTDTFSFMDPAHISTPSEWTSLRDVYGEPEGIDMFLQTSEWDMSGNLLDPNANR